VVFDDFTYGQPQLVPGAPRAAVAATTFAIHLLVIAALAVPALFVSAALPEPLTIMVFVTDAIAPAPPAPPPVTAPRKSVAKKARSVQQAHSERVLSRVRAPIEAPAGIADETGLESLAGAKAEVAAGFEGGISGGIFGGMIGGIDAKMPSPPPPLEPKPVRVGGQITPPRQIRRVEPDYPPLAQAAQIEGTVILEATVSTIGLVESVRVLRAHSLLERAAVDAVSEWEYEPLILNGVPRRFILAVTVSFHMANR